MKETLFGRERRWKSSGKSNEIWVHQLLLDEKHGACDHTARKIKISVRKKFL